MRISYLILVFGVLSLRIKKSCSTSYNIGQFKKDWCRQKMAALDWKAIIKPCKDDMDYNYRPQSKQSGNKTSLEKSVIKSMRIGIPGQFSHIWIESRDALGKAKQYGGDAWRVMVRSNLATVAADVFDYNNGTYEALFLLMDPGTYEVNIKLDYSLCDGLRNPPSDWYEKVHCAFRRPNKYDLSTQLSIYMKDYINQRIGNGDPIKIGVAASKIDRSYFVQLAGEADRECNFPCKKLWDGYGRWNVSMKWIPFVQDNNLSLAANVNTFQDPLSRGNVSIHVKGKGIFWIYGDSLSNYFYQSFSKRKDFCRSIFKTCRLSYNWLYPKELYKRFQAEMCSGRELNISRILPYLRQVINNPAMDQHSALLCNAGIHYAKMASFVQYKKLIGEIVKILSTEFRGKAIWKSTTAIHEQKSLDSFGPLRRFITNQRVKLLNAYSNSEMCKAGVTLLDVYPISASYPQGTIDGIHYKAEVFMPAEELLMSYFNR